MAFRAGPLSVLAAAVLWGTAGTAGALAAADATSLAAARLVLGGAVLAVISMLGARGGAGEGRRTAEESPGGRRRLSRYSSLALGAVAVAAYQLCFFAAVARTGVAIGTVVAIGSGPVFTGLLSWLTERTAPSGRWMLATSAAIAGCAVLIVGGEAGGVGAARVDPGGVALALCGGFLYAFYAVTASRAIARGMRSDAVMGVLFGGAAVLMLPVLVLSGPAWATDPRALLAVAYLGCATTGLAYLLYGWGLRTTPVATAATLSLAEPAVAALLGLIVLHERLSTVSWAGLVLLALSLLVVALPGRTRADQAPASLARNGSKSSQSRPCTATQCRTPMSTSRKRAWPATTRTAASKPSHGRTSSR